MIPYLQGTGFARFLGYLFAFADASLYPLRLIWGCTPSSKSFQHSSGDSPASTAGCCSAVSNSSSWVLRLQRSSWLPDAGCPLVWRMVAPSFVITILPLSPRAFYPYLWSQGRPDRCGYPFAALILLFWASLLLSLTAFF